MSKTNDALGVKSATGLRAEERLLGQAKEKAPEDDVLVRDSRERHWFWMDNDLFTPIIVGIGFYSVVVLSCFSSLWRQS